MSRRIPRKFIRFQLLKAKISRNFIEISSQPNRRRASTVAVVAALLMRRHEDDAYDVHTGNADAIVANFKNYEEYP